MEQKKRGRPKGTKASKKVSIDKPRISTFSKETIESAKQKVSGLSELIKNTDPAEFEDFYKSLSKFEQLIYNMINEGLNSEDDRIKLLYAQEFREWRKLDLQHKLQEREQQVIVLFDKIPEANFETANAEPTQETVNESTEQQPENTTARQDNTDRLSDNGSES